MSDPDTRGCPLPWPFPKWGFPEETLAALDKAFAQHCDYTYADPPPAEFEEGDVRWPHDSEGAAA